MHTLNDHNYDHDNNVYTTQVFTTVSYHVRNPTLNDEIKIKLPDILTPFHYFHLLSAPASFAATGPSLSVGYAYDRPMEEVPT